MKLRTIILISFFLFATNSLATDSQSESVRKYFIKTDWYRFKKDYNGKLKYRGFIPVRKLSTSCSFDSIFYIDTGEIEFNFKELKKIEECEYGKYLTPINKKHPPAPEFIGWGKGLYIGGQLGQPILFYSIRQAGTPKYVGYTYSTKFNPKNPKGPFCQQNKRVTK